MMFLFVLFCCVFFFRRESGVAGARWHYSIILIQVI